MQEQLNNPLEKEVKRANQELLQYSDEDGSPDGHLVLSFSGEGEVSSKYVDWWNPMLIETESGNRYAVGQTTGGGDIIMLNSREGTIHIVDTLGVKGRATDYENDQVPIVLGERLEVPIEAPDGGVASVITTPVKRVFAGYAYTGIGRSSRADRYVDTPSPITSVRSALAKAQDSLQREKYE